MLGILDRTLSKSYSGLSVYQRDSRQHDTKVVAAERMRPQETYLCGKELSGMIGAQEHNQVGFRKKLREYVTSLRVIKGDSTFGEYMTPLDEELELAEKQVYMNPEEVAARIRVRQQELESILAQLVANPQTK